jgi:CubicO group peptidase (beta-lactamase class C family)
VISAPPGANNLCYNVAGLLIERVSGQSYEAFIRSRLTDRLGMTVSFTLEELQASIDAARPYMMHEDERLPALRLPISAIAAGGMNTSVADLAQWMRLHLAKGDYDGERLLSAALIKELLTARRNANDARSRASRLFWTKPHWGNVFL